MNSIEAKQYLELQKERFKNTMAPEMLLATNEAISALGKQVPEKVIGEGHQDLSSYLCSCSVCGSDNILRGDIYCANCGQKLDWSGDKCI